MKLENYKIENGLYKCECGREFKSSTSLNSHFRFCKIHIPIDKTISNSIYKISENLYKCECGKEFNNYQSLNAHLSHCKIHCNLFGREVKLRPHEINHTMCGWEKFSDEEKHIIYDKVKQTLKSKYKSGDLVPYWSNDNFDKTESRKKLSNSISKLREEGKTYCRGSMGYYNGIHCDSSWELAYLIYCLEHNIQIKRCNIRFNYEYNGEQHIYTPDFIINESELIEIKGFKDKRWKEKKKCCLLNNIKIINKENIKPYIKYVKEKYSKNFIRLYE